MYLENAWMIFNNMSALAGHFALLLTEKEKRARRDCRGEERQTERRLRET